MTNERTYQIIIGVLVLIIIIGGWFAFARSAGNSAMEGAQMASSTTKSTGSTAGGSESGSMTSSSSGMSGSTGNTGPASGDTVSVSNQPAGSSVAVSSVTLSQTGWVAVRDASGRILGAALFPAGTHSSVEVPLLRATVSGGSYQVLLYADNGDKQFDLHADTLLLNESGSVAGTTFTAN